MVAHRCTANLVMTTGVPEDAATNTFYFDINAVNQRQQIETALEDFYQDVAIWLSPLLAASGHTFTWYDMTDTSPRAPIDTQGFSLGSRGTGPLPPEVSSVVSFQAEKVSGSNQARRRGRIYLGPLNNATVGTDGRFVTAFTTAVAGAASDVLAASQAAADWDWIVFSQTTGLASVVDNGWCDNEPDTQRRRGRTATVRTTFA